MTRRARLLVPLLLVALAACGGEEPAPSALPTGQPAPSGYAEHTVGGLTFSTPEEWEQVQEPETGVVAGAPVRLALRAPSAEDAVAPVALALVAPEPTRPLEDEVEALLALKRDVHRAEDVTEQELALPGFTGATLVSYREPQGTGGPQRADVLLGELADGAVVTLTVLADPEVFEEQGLSAVALSARAPGTSS